MPELSIIEIIKYAIKSLMSSKVFILILLELALLLVSGIFYRLMNKKTVKYTSIIASIIILLFYIVNYISTIKVFLNNVSTKLLEFIYFPTTLEFMIILSLSCLICIYTLIKQKNKYIKFINTVLPISILFIFLSIIEYINKNNIAFDEFSVFSNPILMSLYELATGLFISWIIGLIIYKIDVFIINRITIVSEEDLPKEEYFLPKKRVEEEIELPKLKSQI